MLPRLAELMRMDARRLLWQHTAFPYITAFMASEVVARFEAKVLGDGARGGSLSSLVQSVTHGLPMLQYCPDCAFEDITEWGESYWHREHSLPATHVCSRHGNLLHRSRICASAASRAYAVGLPERQAGRPEAVALDREVLSTLAGLSQELLTRAQGHLSDWPEYYRQLSRSKGFVMVDGQVASGQMAADLRAFFGSAYVDALGCRVRDPGRSWPALMVREHTGVPFAPVKHVLLRTFLEHCDDSPKALSYRPPGRAPKDPSSLDERLAKRVRKAVVKVRLRNARTTVTQLMVATGHWGAYRHDRNRFPKTQAELLAFRLSEASERKLGGRAAHRKRMARRAAPAGR